MTADPVPEDSRLAVAGPHAQDHRPAFLADGMSVKGAIIGNSDVRTGSILLKKAVVAAGVDR